MANLKDKITIIGFGQCGGQLAYEFDQLNYNTFYVNTSVTDFPKDIDNDKKYLINGARGCAKNMSKAIEYGSKYFNDILDKVDARYPLASICYYIFGSGGGTGAGITPLMLDMAIAKYPNKKYCAVVVLPSDTESLLSQDNAKKSLKMLLDIKDDLYSIHLLSNNKRDDFLQINSEFAMLLDGVISDDFYSEKGNIDDEEKEQMVTDQGFTTIVEFESDNFKTGFNEALNKSIYADWNSDCRYLGLVLNENFNKDKAIPEIENEFGIPLTDFTTFTKDISNKVIATGMSFNRNILRNINTNIKDKLKKKEELESKNEDIEDIEDINLPSMLKEKKKPSNNKTAVNTAKDFNSILDKYKNI